MNQSIICWKWDDRSMEDNLIEKAKDLTGRFGADTVCVAAHWVQKAFDDPKLIGRFKQVADYLHSIGKKLCVEACIRNEGIGFFKEYPLDKAWLSHMVQVPLDEEGKGALTLDIEPVYHYWRISGQQGPEKVLAAWILTKEGEDMYLKESCVEIKDKARIQVSAGEEAGEACRQMNFGGSIESGENNITNTLYVEAGKEQAGKTAVVILGTPQPIPDLASPHLISYYRKMLEAVKAANVDGVFSDEWGYDVILKIVEVNPYDDRKLFLRHLSVSDQMAVRYASAFDGKDLYADMLHCYFAPVGAEHERIAAINRYISVLRGTMAKNDREMMAAMKEILGPDKFYGIHPTWWGSVDSLNFEVFKNGFYWWEAKRDIAQTDETVIMPIRTALSHKWGSSIWYNMWYSMGTLDINTYFRETWNNLRYGGRTHYHGYECPNEAVVLELAQEGLLEQLEEMDARVRLIEPYQTSQPDSRVLMLFGMEAVSNWKLCGKPHPNWTPQNVNLDLVLNTAAKLYDTLIFDLVPTTEIANGSLVLKDDRAVYGTQDYDTVVLLLPESMDRRCFDFIRKLDKEKLLVYGNGTIYNDGLPLSKEHKEILAGAKVHMNEVPKVSRLAEDILATGAAKNRFENGCIFQDGSAVFTGDGTRNKGNELTVDCELSGHKITFTGEDFLFIRVNGGKVEACTPAPGVLTVDGEAVKLRGGTVEQSQGRSREV